ncbi:MAG: hypothetical protein ACLQGP_00560 [Isosphaeraceae bacterium]
MSRLQCRGSIAGAVVVVALLWSRPADAQIGVDPGPPREPGGLLNNVLTGVQYDIVNQALAEHRLQKLQAKLRSDAERGDRAAVDCDLRRIDNLKYRIVIDEWLIRWNSRQYPDFYPIRTDPVSCAAIAQATHPIQVPDALRQIPPPRPMAAAPTIRITIVNAEPAGDRVEFSIDGLTHQAPAGSRQDLDVAPDSYITYDSGGSLGERRYRIPPGLYEFRSTAEGWALYKVPGMP